MHQLDESYSPDEVKPIFWKLNLYELQNKAPKPKGVECSKADQLESQSHYGAYYHGRISQRECRSLLVDEGHFLIRSSQSANGHLTLSFRMFDQLKHYKLFYDGLCHYVGGKKFPKLEDLVGDGLVTLYLEKRVGHILSDMPTKDYHKSPHFTLSRFIQRFQRKKKRKEEKDKIIDRNILKCFEEDDYGQIISDDLLERCESQEDLSSSSHSKNQNSLPKSVSPMTVFGDENTDSPHRFIPQSFKGLHWCGYCGNFLWGLVLQGVKCQDCGLQTHSQCSTKVPRDCCPSMKNFYCIFGMDLTTSLQCNPYKSGDLDVNVPQIVLECISEIEARGLATEGLYRACGSLDLIESLRLSYERDAGATSLDAKSVADINAVAGLLKLYLRLLPLRLITKECLQELVTSNQIRVYASKIAAVNRALRKLPECHVATLNVIIPHLARVCEHSAANKMTATSLGTIFGPTIVQTDEPESMEPADLLLLKLSAQDSRIIEMLIVMNADIFAH